jgi:Zn-finger nucleic acid-binding protein
MLKCPEDAAHLVVASSEGHCGHVCSRCSGTWLPSSYVESIAHQRHFEPQGFVLALSTRSSGVTALACPHDGTLLSRADMYDIELDWCGTCQGIWFNSGELSRLLSMHPLKESSPGSVLAADAGIGVLLALLFS